MDLVTKKVVCLYRVSTKSQLIEDDIPVQRNACLEFISRQKNWELVDEYLELGVSGYKVGASDREVLEKLKKDALEKKYDIIVVFMFDRLGRIEEETPYVLKWFVDKGIEMWSVKEGQRVLDTHIDSLINYITFWQASGESKKTQQRTLEAKKQMVKEGKYLGAPPAYGYKHITTGKHNEKGREIKKLVINQEEARIVKKIFDLSSLEGFGSRRIARELNEMGVPTKKGNGIQWAGSTISGILKNTIYKGYFSYGRYSTSQGKRIYRNQRDCETSKIKQDELVIIWDDQWEEVQKLISLRAGKGKNECINKNINKRTRNKEETLLFIGFIYCKDCKSKLTSHYSYKKRTDEKDDKNKIRIPSYVCYASENGQSKCQRRYYLADNVEGAVMEEVYEYLNRLEKVDMSNYIREEWKKQLKTMENTIKSKNRDIKEHEANLNLLGDEVVKTLKLESEYPKEVLSDLIKKTQDKRDNSEIELLELHNKIEKFEDKYKHYNEIEQDAPIWEDIIKGFDQDIKRVLLHHLIESIEVGENSITIKMNMKIDDFFSKKIE